MIPEFCLPLTQHARARMDSRRISMEAVEVVLAHGREANVRGARIYALGHKEVAHASQKGMDLRPFQGIQVVCVLDGDVMTTYRSHNFRDLRKAA